jgi:acyl transferase domain-containing protein
LPSIAVFQIALYELLSFLNIKPDIVMGHSAGETAVLYVSGAASKAMAVELAVIRGRVFSSIESADGTMAALSCGAEQALELIAAETPVGRDMVADIACYNSPSDVAIAGHKPALQRIVQAAGERGIYARIIRTNVPIHSSMMESCRTAYEAELSSLFERYPALHTPLLPTVSTLTGSIWSGSYDAAYFWKSTRDPVLFTSALETLTTLESGLTFVEISPHPVLSSYISRTLDSPDFVLSPARRPPSGSSQSEHSDLLSFCGRLTVLGHNCVDFQALNGIGYSAAVSIASLPPYPFSKKAFPLYPDTPGVAKQMASRRGPLNSDYLRINKSTHPVLAEHVIRGETIMPAAGFLEMVSYVLHRVDVILILF